MTRAELDYGRHPFRITWAGYNPGNERMYEREDKTHTSLQRLINPEAFIKAGMFYVKRWIWTPEKELCLDENNKLQKGDIYYDVTFGKGNYSFNDVRNGHRALAKLASRDDKVSMLIGITWLNEFAKRWGWTTAFPIETHHQSAGIQEMIRVGDLTLKSLTGESIADKAKKAVKSKNFTPVLTYITKEDLMSRYG